MNEWDQTAPGLSVNISSCSSILKPSLEVIKLFSCSSQLSMKLFLLINVEMPTIVGISTFMARKNSVLVLSEPENAEFLGIFILMSIYNFMLSRVEHGKNL